MDPELAGFVPSLSAPDYRDAPAERARRAAALADEPGLRPEVAAALLIEDRTVPGDPVVPVRLYRPRAGGTVLPGVIWLHGGGFVAGSVAHDHHWAAELAVETGALIVSVDYRLAPEHAFPAALDDADVALAWLADHHAELGVDPGRIAVAGSSAGAGLAAALALRVRDRGDAGAMPCFQLLNHPALDDRMTTVSSRTFTTTPNLTRDDVAVVWRHYLGETPAAAVSAHAAPARARDLSGLPSAYIATSELDPLRDEGIAYAQRLLHAGVTAELHVFPGTFHGSQGLPAAVSRRQNDEISRALRGGLGLAP